MRLSPSILRALLPLVLPLGIALIAGCSSDDRTPERPGGRAGTLKVYTATYEDGRAESQFFLKAGDEETRLFFDVDPVVDPGTEIEVWGKDQEDGLHVTDMRVDKTVSTVSEALINAMPYPAKKFAFVFVDIGGGINITKDEATKRMFGTNMGDNSVKQYYLEASYNTQDVSGDVYGPFQYTEIGCDTTGLASTLKPKVNAMIPGGMADHYLWYLGSRNASCGWSGLAEAGTPANGGTIGGRYTANDTWYNASAGCVVLVQEPGHNFGMQHSSSMTCSNGQPFADTPQGTCTHNEYGDKYDPMGGGCYHMNAWQKTLQGWLSGCNILRVKSSGSYTLLPFEPQCDGPQVLQIPMPKVRPFTRSGGGGTSTNEQLAFYYLELRTARGFDTGIRSAPTVLVHVAEELRDRTKTGRHTWILDMNPMTTTLDGLGAGASFSDPGGGGLSFKVDSISADQAQISVTIPGGTGGPTCMDGSPQPMPPNTTCNGIVTTPGGNGGMGGMGGIGGQGGMGGATTMPPPAVEQLTLVNADTELDIMPVTEASTLNLDVLPPNLTARVDTDPMMVGSVSIVVDGGAARVENTYPYSVTPHPTPTDYTPWALAVGSHTITATPYTGPNATGTVGMPMTVTFTLSRASAMGTGGVPVGAAGTTPGIGAGGVAALGVGGAHAGAAGTQAFGGLPGTTGFGVSGYAGFGGLVNGATADGGNSGCTCRLADHPSSGNKQLGLAALAAGLMIARRRRSVRG